MATLSSAGIGSGLDVRGIVAQLMAIERQPLQALQSTQKKAEDQLSAYGKLQAAMSALRDAASRLASRDTWNATTVASANAAAVAASSSGKAPVGSYSVGVARLAAAQTVVSGTTWASATEAIGAGSLTLEVGRWDAGQTTFTPQDGTAPTTLTFAIGGDTLEDVRDAINGAGAGVTASIVNDADGARLALRSTLPGAANGFRITVSDDDGDDGDAAGLSQLAFDPASGVSQMTQTLAAANASATINGVPVSATTNALDDVMDGLSLTLGQVTTSNVDVTVNRDNASMRTAVTAFASAYNDLVKLVREQTRVGEGGAAGGILQGDSSAIGMLNQMRSLIGSSSGAASAFTRLTEVGLEPQRDGTLKVNDRKLDAALANLDEMQEFFARDEPGAEFDGFAALFKTFAGDRLAEEGVLSTRQEALRDRIERYTDRRSRLEDRLAMVEKRLTEQYGRLDTSISRLSSLQNYVSQQLAQWNKTG